MGYQVKYNGVEWYSTYNFRTKKNGIIGRFDLPAPRDDELEFQRSADYPVSIGAIDGLRRIIVVGRISGTDHDDLLDTLVSFVNALDVLRAAGEWKDLYFEDSPIAYYYSALPYSVKTEFIGNAHDTKYAKVTVVFNCKHEIQEYS